MKKIYVIALNIGYWLFFIVLLGILYSASQINSNTGPTFIDLLKLVFGYILVPSVVSFYGAYFILFHQFIHKKETGRLITVSMSIVFAASIIAVLNINSTVNSPRVFVEAGLLSVLLNAFNTLIGFILHSFISWFTDLKEKEALSQKTKALELEMVKMKLDPHFLFNTINNIDVLIASDAEKASEYILKLSSILRFYLYKTSDTVIQLSEEISYIQQYIDLQKIRTSNQHFVNFTLEGDAGKKEIIPMIFIPFIENAFKHAVNKKKDTISIHILIHENDVYFSCKNKLNKSDKPEIGIGNKLLESRLQLIYGKNYTLDVEISDNEYSVNLKVPV